MRVPTRVTVLACILTLLPACEHHTLSTAERQLSMRIKSTFGISLPCSLSRCEGGGGVVGGLMVDTKGESLKWAWGRPSDGIVVPEWGDRDRVEAYLDSVFKNPPTLAYVGAEDYRAPGARPLSVGSSAESLFIQLLWYVVGADSVYSAPLDRAVHKRLFASSAARGLQRQRAGKTPLRKSQADTS